MGSAIPKLISMNDRKKNAKPNKYEYEIQKVQFIVCPMVTSQRDWMAERRRRKEVKDSGKYTKLR